MTGLTTPYRFGVDRWTALGVNMVSNVGSLAQIIIILGKQILIVVIHMCVVLQARVDLASNKDNMLKSDNVWLAGDAAWLVGNIELPEADVASTQQKKLAAVGYSASPCRKLWLQKGED
ncbi:hypothetical protein DSO57_1021663 [Entomophthora muscae]|uniref:Uncharacterized protein n=1 Tax=Entomophthora muscae TaxID=34485 RepID=A0ACC2SGE1_9FUNG|nr:hypothetical protein DSO57_1021663 [Entomophthora muscae]